MIHKRHDLTLTDEEMKNMPEPSNLLNGMQTILRFAEDSALCDTYFENVKVPMDYLSRRLNLTPTQVTLLAIIMELGFQHPVSLSDISRFLDTSNLEILEKSTDLNTLITRRMLSEHNSRYDVPREVYEAFRQNQCYTYKIPTARNDEELADRIDRMLSAIDRNTDLDLFDTRLRELLLENSTVHLARTLLGALKKLSEHEFRILVLMSMYWIRDEETDIDGNQLNMMFDRNFECRKITSEITNGRSPLVKKKFVKVSATGGFMSHNSFSLTPQFRKQLTPDRKEKDDDGDETNSRLTLCADIKPKDLFYNPDAIHEVERLQNVLQPEQMNGVLKRLKERGLRGGFTCLLYGGPGTGKTETVLQLARRSGRDIFQVEVSQLRSKWYGESEKLVKGIFDEYRKMVSKSKVAPIMFFNEADAIFNRRMENAERAVDKGENALQNIILQEMETLNGILIATTNLADSLDPAFERRFLYKLFLDKPTTEVKAHIWQSMLPDLSEEESLTLAREFDFSGGQIENVVRKRFIDEVLTGERIDLDALQTLCRNDQLGDNKGKQPIGFMRYNG